ncbi:hypothetical protein ACWCXB_32400 [Streptomyces sp. NPDC001514]
MTMSNLKNAFDLVRLARGLDVDIPALLDVISDSSGGSASLSSLGTTITPEIAPHLQGLMRKDIEHFADTIRAHGLHPEELHGRAGADGLVEVVTPLHPTGHAA